MPELKLGRLPRAFDPNVPKYMNIRASIATPPRGVPVAHDWAQGLPENLGMMLNDQLGCCVCAGAYHALQLMTEDARGVEITEPDQFVLQLYEEAAGYKPGDPSTDNGTVMQDFLKLAVNTGIPIPEQPSGRNRHKYLAFIEIDPKNTDSMCEAIYECGCVSIGFNVPQFLMPEDGATPQRWDVNPSGDNTIIGGHCVELTGFDKSAKTYNLMSWGSHAYTATWDFIAQFCDEAYAIVDPSWIEVTGQTLLDLTPGQLELAMAGLRAA